MTEKRIATIKENGRQYKINKLDFDRRVAHVFGEVSGYKGTTTYHSTGSVLSFDDIEIKKINWTAAHAKVLFSQYLKNGEEDGIFEVLNENGLEIRYIIPGKSNTDAKSLKMDEGFSMGLDAIENKWRETIKRYTFKLRNAAIEIGRLDLIKILENKSDSFADRIEKAYCNY